MPEEEESGQDADQQEAAPTAEPSPGPSGAAIPALPAPEPAPVDPQPVAAAGEEPVAIAAPPVVDFAPALRAANGVTLQSRTSAAGFPEAPAPQVAPRAATPQTFEAPQARVPILPPQLLGQSLSTKTIEVVTAQTASTTPALVGAVLVGLVAAAHALRMTRRAAAGD